MNIDNVLKTHGFGNGGKKLKISTDVTGSISSNNLLLRGIDENNFYFIKVDGSRAYKINYKGIVESIIPITEGKAVGFNQYGIIIVKQSKTYQYNENMTLIKELLHSSSDVLATVIYNQPQDVMFAYNTSGYYRAYVPSNGSGAGYSSVSLTDVPYECFGFINLNEQVCLIEVNRHPNDTNKRAITDVNYYYGRWDPYNFRYRFAELQALAYGICSFED
ncbi:MAG: hypothetical protein N4A50_06180 [Vallitalea sp.]|jgi:hypothetical protein|nr:hypothetical protein [Vallitalea sp.]